VGWVGGFWLACTEKSLCATKVVLSTTRNLGRKS